MILLMIILFADIVSCGSYCWCFDDDHYGIGDGCDDSDYDDEMHLCLE